MRVFVAVDVSEQARLLIGRRIESFRNRFSALRVGWEKVEKLHLTLKFLGETSEAKLTEVVAAVENSVAETNTFSLEIAGAGAFPKRDAARVLWLGIEDETASLVKIRNKLDSECGKIGFERESKKFNPHLTIARLKEPAVERELTELHLKTDFPTVKFEVSEIAIYKSELRPTGSVYTRLAGISLSKLMSDPPADNG